MTNQREMILTDRQLLENVDRKLDMLGEQMRHARRDAAIAGGVAGALTGAIVSASVLLIKIKLGG